MKQEIINKIVAKTLAKQHVGYCCGYHCHGSLKITEQKTSYENKTSGKQ